MAVTRINNNQISDASSGNAYLGVNAASKIQDYSITSGKIANNLNYGSDLTVTGNLTVNGTSTTIDTTVTTIEDPVLVLASTQTGSPAVDIGFIGERGSSDNIAFVWDESADEFVTVFTSTSETNTTITISSYANFHTNDANIGGNISITGTTLLSGNATVGNIFFGSSKTIDAGNNIIGNVAEPVANADAATKNYVDSQLSSSGFDITDGVTTETVYPGDTITFSGVANETTVDVTATDTITIGLPDDVTVAGNLLANKFDSNTTINASGTITGGNLATSGNVTASIISASGNITANASIFATQTITAQGTITGGNVETTGIVSAIGNITGGNIITNGAVSLGGSITLQGGEITGANSIGANSVTATGNINAGNLIATNNVIATGGEFSANVTAQTFYGNLVGDIVGNVDAAGSNTQIQFNNNDILGASSSLTFDTSNNTLFVGGNIQGGNLTLGDRANGIGTVDVATVSANTLSVGNSGDITVYDASGNSQINLDGVAGEISASGNIIGGNLRTSGWASVTGNITGGNLSVATVDATNVNATTVSASGNIDGNNINATNYVTGANAIITSNITGGNILTSGIVSATGNVYGNNLNISNNITAGTLDVVAGPSSFQGNVGITGNLLVAGNVTYIGVQDLTVDDPIIYLAANNVADLDDIGFVGNWDNGTYQHGGLVRDHTDGTWKLFANVVAEPTTVIDWPNAIFQTYQVGTLLAANNITANSYITSLGNVTGANINTAGLISATGNIIGGNLVTAGSLVAPSIEATGNITGGNILTSGIVSAVGNITGGNIITNGAVSLSGSITLQGGNITGANVIGANTITASANISGGNLSITGMTSSGNIETSGYVSAVGNVIGGNLVTSGNVDVTSTVNAGVVNATGNITGGNISTTGRVDVGGNIHVHDVIASGSVNATLDVTANNITAANVLTTNNINASGNVDIAVNLDVTGNITGGNITATANMYAQNFFGNITGNIDAAGANTQVQYNDNDLLGASSNFTFDSSFNSNGGLLNVGFGIGGEVQTDTITANVGIDSNGYISAVGNIVGGNILTFGLMSASGTITGGNIETGGYVSATGNVTANGITANDSLTVGGSITGVNIQGPTGSISASGNIVSGNVSAGAVTATTVTGGNIVISGDDITDTNGRVNFNTAGDDVDFAVNGDTVANILYVDAGTGTVSFGNSTQTTGALAAFNTSTSVLMPVGNTAQRPVTGVTGMLRFSTTENALEVFDNTEWKKVGVPLFTVIVDDQFNGDGSTVAFVLSQESTTAGTVVSINGVMQIPTTAYSVSGTTLTFTEAPEPGDVIDVRIFTTTTSVSTISNATGNATVSVPDDASQVDIQGNLIPTANIAYDLGNATNQWKDLWLSGNTIHLGNTVIKNTGGNTIGFFGPNGTTPATIDSASIDTTTIANGTSGVAVVTSGGSIRSNVAGATVQTISTTGVAVTGVVSASGNVTGNYLLGNAFYVTGLSPTKIYNGTTEVNIGSSNGNANISVGGTSNVAVFATTGVTVTGTLTTGAQAITGVVNQTGNLNITGNLNVTGNVNYTNVNDLVVGDPLIYMAANNVANLDDIGIVGNFDNGTYQHTGFARDASNGTWKLFSNVIPEPTNTIDFTNAIYDPIQTGAITATSGSFSLTVSATGNITGGNLSVGTGTISGGNIVNTNANGVGNIGSSTTYFNTAFVKATSAQYADLAEKYVADAEYPAGTVVVFGGDKEVTVTSVDGDRAVAGVVSTNPSYIMNGGLEAEFVATVALTGRVPCRVTGTVRKGDLMVSAGYGLARAEQDPKVGTVIGKALENFEGNEGVIEVVVGRF